MKAAALLVVFPALFLCACAGGKSVATGKSSPAARPSAVPSSPRPPVTASIPRPSTVPPPAKPPAPAPAGATPADREYCDGAAALMDGRYEQALDLFALAWKEGPGHAGVLQDFPGALAAIKKSGDDAYLKGRSEEAGRRWAVTLRYMTHPAAKGKPLPFQKADVQASLDRLSAALMEKGLAEYRQGNLDNAIATWRTILGYDPSHEEAAKSVRTATTQLENLKKLAPAAPPAK